MSASNGVSVSGSGTGTIANEVEVMAKATRRRFSAEYKLKILREAEACTQRGRSARCCVGRDWLLSSPLL